MINRVGIFALALTIVVNSTALPSCAQAPSNSGGVKGSESRQLDSTFGISAEAAQVLDQLKLTPYFNRLFALRARVAEQGSGITLESVSLKQELLETKQHIIDVVLETSLEIDSVVAEINVEKARYDHALRIASSRRDQLQAITNAASFGTNGALWTVAEALAIPTWSRPKYSISSGAIGIMAGIVPSAFSLYALKTVSGGHYSYDESPNILSKMFNLPVTPEIDYPDTVWSYLNTAPTGRKDMLTTRRRWLIDFWLHNKDLPSMKNEHSEKQVARVTATLPGRHSVTIELLTTRLAMLEQLSAMVFHMKKLLMELVRTVKTQ